jgi:hypothetical protein
MNRLVLPASELPPLTPSHAHAQPARSRLAWLARDVYTHARHVAWHWLSLLLPGALLVFALATGGFEGMPAWVWLSVLLFGSGLMLEMHE